MHSGRLHSLALSVVATVLLMASELAAQDGTVLVEASRQSLAAATSPFQNVPDSAEVSSLLREVAEASRFPASDADRVLEARLWRLAGESDLAIRALIPIAPESNAAPAGLYELAKVYFEAGHVRPGARAYWASCAKRSPAVRQALAEDLLPVSTPKERMAWPWSDSGQAGCDALRSFWDDRALRAAVPRDERIAEHYQRSRKAREAYYLKAPRRVVGMSNEYGRPDGFSMDDRGLLTIRLGPPDYEQSCPEEVIIGDDRVDRAGGLRNLTGICWAYWRPEGYKLFYLSTRDRFGEDWPYGDYRIQENLSQQAEPGTNFFQKYVMNSDLPEQTKQRFIRRGPVFRNAKLAAAGVATSLEQDFSGELSTAEALTLRREVRDETRRQTREILTRIPDVPAIESTTRLRFEALRFFDPQAGQWDVFLLSSVRAGDLAAPAREEAINVRGIAVRAVMLLGGRLSVLPFDTVRFSVGTVPDDAGIPLRGALTADPGPLPITVVVEDLNARGAGAWIHDTINVPSPSGLPQLSDIAVAQAEGGTWTRDGRTFLQVSPAHVTNPDGSIHAYFEAYGVRVGERYEVELRLAPTESADRIWRLEPGDLGFRLSFTAEMPGTIGRHHQVLDLSGTEPGAYVLGVRIRDERTGAYSLPSVTDLFVAKPD